MAGEEKTEVEKKVEEVAAPVAFVHGVHAFGVDDGKYFPGKYEKTLYPYSYGAYPYSYGAYPYSYGAYPYSYGAYPYGYGAFPHHYGYNYPFAARHVFLAVAVACALAVDEPERVKKDVVLGSYPYLGVHSVGYDDGKYYPGKYEGKAIVTPYTAGAYHYGAYPYTHGVYPYAYGAYPYNYGAYPYAYGAYPYNYGYNYPLAARTIVY
ncbi:hypothetical protein AAG570_000543 [Ranatra chinensis]|uniref:Uncharacterized protein n=1 Tax=Ranatra chinensis TaxID=642074 RepID=A0ABD0YXD2_9HEMI